MNISVNPVSSDRMAHCPNELLMALDNSKLRLI